MNVSFCGPSVAYAWLFAKRPYVRRRSRFNAWLSSAVQFCRLPGPYLHKSSAMQAICLSMRCLCFLCVPSAIWSQTFVNFDVARTSSTYSTGAFSADQALSAGSGYWCRPRSPAHIVLLVRARLSRLLIFSLMQLRQSQFRRNRDMDWRLERSTKSSWCKAELVSCAFVSAPVAACLFSF